MIKYSIPIKDYMSYSSVTQEKHNVRNQFEPCI